MTCSLYNIGNLKNTWVNKQFKPYLCLQECKTRPVARQDSSPDIAHFVLARLILHILFLENYRNTQKNEIRILVLLHSLHVQQCSMRGFIRP